MKLKKVLAVVLAATMIMGMSVTTFAADQTSITVVTEEGTATDAKLTKLQVIGADPTTETGWKFVNNAGSAYTAAFGVATEQDAIWSLIKYELTQQGITDYSGFSEAAQAKLNGAKEISASDLDSALSKVYGTLNESFIETENPITVDAAGVYAIHASADGFTYKMMAAYVGFTVADDGTYPTLPEKIDDITEKGAPTDITKTGTDTEDGATDESNVVSIGDIVTYEITTVIPFIDPEAFTNPAVEPFFNITDELNGGVYVLTTEDGDNDYTIEYTDTEPATPINATIELNDDETNGFTIDLSNELNEANSNAGRPVKITYKARITDVTTDNEALGHVDGKDFDGEGNTDKFVTGSVQLTKVDADDTAEDKTGLAGAEFQVYDLGTGAWTSADGLTPLSLVYDDTVQAYRPALPTDPEASVVTTLTDRNDNGIFKIVGLDTGNYHFVETKAPNGYTINEDGKTITISAPEQEATAALETVKDELTDTKLSSLPLPSTGGMGTTIFTIGGCVIMIAAAGLYFASRRKENK